MSRCDAHPSKGRCPCQEAYLYAHNRTTPAAVTNHRGAEPDQEDWDTRAIDVVLSGVRCLISGKSPWVITSFGSVLTLIVRSASEAAGRAHTRGGAVRATTCEGCASKPSMFMPAGARTSPSGEAVGSPLMRVDRGMMSRSS